MKMYFDNEYSFEKWCADAIQCAKREPWELQDWFFDYVDDFRFPEIQTGDLILDTKNEIAVENGTFKNNPLCPEFWNELKQTVEYWKSFDE